jgi:restriction system protein
MADRAVYEIEVKHIGLNKYRHIRGTDRDIVQQKAAAQERAWNEMWEKKVEAEKKRQERESAMQSKEEKRQLAIQKTEEAEGVLQSLENTLARTLTVNDAIDWSALLDRTPFPTRRPVEPQAASIPREPQQGDKSYQVPIGLIGKLLPSIRRKKEEEAERLFRRDRSYWEQQKRDIERDTKRKAEAYAKALSAWRALRRQYEEKQKLSNDKVLAQRQLYLDGSPDAISDYCEMVLSNSVYPEFFPREWDLEYLPDTRVLILDYSLPNIDQLPTLKSVKYVAARDSYSETHLSGAAVAALYDSLLYQISIRTIHELYEADVTDALASVVFNGWVNSVEKATGQEVNACILSLQASKPEFLKINLAAVDPKACFKQLKGVGSSKLHGLSPVAPILALSKEDKRFVSAYGVADAIQEEDNLAAMDWQDFENLIREMFEKEFASSGGEVKITQASRDGGVDAIAFDPDPIRGGKIVIQAKRYTNVVGVSAVRDLFGTTVNEGATKGILVTTANFGPDAYEFAKGKPLTLLNGANLLHLLEKHGHKARIDLKEAKKILADRM